MKAAYQNVKMELVDRPKDLARLEINEEEIKGLADSIRERGLQQPIKVARRGERFAIIFGDRRFLACALLGLKSIETKVVDANDGEIAVDRAIENLQRVDLTPYEEALQYKGLAERTGLTLREVAEKVGVNKTTVWRRVEMLKFPENLLEAVHSGKINLTVGEELMDCKDAAHRDYLLEMAIEHGVKADLARQWVQDWRKDERAKARGETRGEGDESLPLHKTEYMTCGLCDGPVPIDQIKSVLVCDGCFEKLNELLSEKPA